MKKLTLSSVPLHKRIRVLWKRLYLYPVPEPLPYTRLFWLAFGLVTFAFLLFSGYFICYVTHLQMAYATNAEDLGIMDQAIWSTLHGQVLHQTICNTISEPNCAGPEGITRLAIHVEPILFPISLLYMFWPDPRTLLVLQTIVVAAGAYPAFWIARLRLRSELGAVIVALLYLLYPVQQQATTDDFHAVTLTASLLLFTFYFLYTRRIGWLFVFALLSMACKEEIPLVITMFGLWSLLFQRYWHVGLILVIVGLCWFCLAFYVVMPHFSPTGKPLLISRYADLGEGPMQAVISIFRNPVAFFKQYVLDPDHLLYLRILFSPAIFLPLLAPWALFMAAPSLLINLTSSSKDMYSGLYQYNAEIVPVLIIATIEALVFLLWLVRLIKLKWKLVQNLTQRTRQALGHAFPSFSVWRGIDYTRVCVLVMLLGLIFFKAVRSDVVFHGRLPFSVGFDWPSTSAHTALAKQFIEKIPPDVSVSAQSELVPHISQRSAIYLFPYEADQAQYIFLDVTSDVYPYDNFYDYLQAVKGTLSNSQYGVVAAQDGYLLLERGLSSTDPVSCSIDGQSQDNGPGPVLSSLLENTCPQSGLANHPMNPFLVL